MFGLVQHIAHGINGIMCRDGISRASGTKLRIDTRTRPDCVYSAASITVVVTAVTDLGGGKNTDAAAAAVSQKFFGKTFGGGDIFTGKTVDTEYDRQ